MSLTYPPSEEPFASQKQDDRSEGANEDDFDLIMPGPMEERPGSGYV